MIASLCDGVLRVDGFGASADTIATVPPCARSASRSRGPAADAARPRRRPARPASRPRSGSTSRTRARSCGSCRGAGRPDRGVRARRRRQHPPPADGADRRAAGPDGRRPSRRPTAARRSAITATGRSTPITYRLPVASAQVKSCVLLAGPLRRARGDRGRGAGPDPRPHRADAARRPACPSTAGRAGSPCRRSQELHLDEVDVPGDFSSAAPFVVAATSLSGSGLTLRGVGINPTRTGLLTVMERMGARVGSSTAAGGGEPVADIEVRPAELVAAEVEPELVPLADRRAAAGRPARMLRPRRHHDPRGGRAARQGVRPDRGDRGRGAERGRRPRRAARGRLPDPRRPRPAARRERRRGRRPPGCDARRRRRRLLAARRRGARLRRARRELPRLRGAPGRGERLTRGGDHRRPRGRRQEHRRPRRGRAARLPPTSTRARCTAS